MSEQRSRLVVCWRCYHAITETRQTSFSRGSRRLVLARLSAHLRLSPDSDRSYRIAEARAFRAQWTSPGRDCFSSSGNSQFVGFVPLDRPPSIVSKALRNGRNECYQTSQDLFSDLKSLRRRCLMHSLF